MILLKSKSTKALFGDFDEDLALINIKNLIPDIITHLLQFEQKAQARYDQGDYWWELRNCAYYHLFDLPKIIFPNLQNRNKFSLDERGIYINAPAVMLSLAHLPSPLADRKYLLTVLNSKLIWFFLKSICVVRSGGYIEVKPQYFEQIPVPSISDESMLPFVEKANLMLSLNIGFQDVTQKFQRTIQRKFTLEELLGKLQNWYQLSYKEFIAELAKMKVKLTLSEEAEWESYLLQECMIVQQLKAQIDATDAAIDQMVYKLYELTDEEISIVEGKN